MTNFDRCIRHFSFKYSGNDHRLATKDGDLPLLNTFLHPVLRITKIPFFNQVQRIPPRSVILVGYDVKSKLTNHGASRDLLHLVEQWILRNSRIRGKKVR